jgi:hypothetical protein
MPYSTQVPEMPAVGELQQRAAQLRAESEARAVPKPPDPQQDSSEEPPAQPADEPADAGPVGQGEHVVGPGDCISSIAKQFGFLWETVWDDPANATLKTTRKDPNVWLPGDRVTIPVKNTKTEPGQTEMRHRFKRKGEPTKLRLRILDQDKPRANEPYTLDIEGQIFTGTTDAEGRLEQVIPATAKTGTLKVGQDEDEYVLELGDIDPVSSITGLQGRLNNLGYPCGAVDGILGPRTEQALQIFQREHQLTESGKPDQATQDKLVEVHGC